jgi:hypothetical protein
MKSRTSVECENPTVTLTLGAVEARWLISGFEVSQKDYCNKGSQRHFEGKELVENLKKSVNEQVDFKFCN